MIIITQRPERVNNSAALFSYWGSAHQPYIFNLHRQDIQLISTNADVLGNLIVKASYFSSSSSGLVVGDSIYIASGNLLSDGTYQYYNKSVTILSILTDGET